MEENKHALNSDKEERNKNLSKASQEQANIKENEEENKDQQTEEQDLRTILSQMSDEEIAAWIAKAQIADFYLDSLQKMKAEYENYQKRMEKERASQIKYALQPILSKLLGILDILETAIYSGTQASPTDKNFFEGICLAHKEFLKILQDFGLDKIQSIGEKFNPLYHEAVLQKESSDHANMTVLEEVQTGYRFQDRLLRASKVIVSHKPKVDSPSVEEQKA